MQRSPSISCTLGCCDVKADWRKLCTFGQLIAALIASAHKERVTLAEGRMQCANIFRSR